MRAWYAAARRATPEVAQGFADALTEAGTNSLLLLLGQRRTPGSITDARAIPPTRAELLAAAARRHTPSDNLTVAGRALAKHVARSAGLFWGEIRGPSAVTNERAMTLLCHILDGATWWNVFGHFLHEVVYEARLPSGQGARWDCRSTEFIGFLEPFNEAQCPSLRPRS
jgi:hypothetical protein